MSDFQLLDDSEEFDTLEDSWSWQKMLQPPTLVAVGLHLLLLILPIAGSQNQTTAKPKTPEKKDDQVKLTTLSADTVLGASPSIAPAPKPSISDPTKPAPNPSGIPSPSPNKSAEPKIPPKAIPTITPSPKTSTPSPSPKASTPSPSPSTPSPKPSSSPVVQPFAGFPTYPGVTNGTGDLKGTLISADSIDKVAAFYARELKARGFDATEESSSPPDKAFRISKGNESKYLSLIVNNSGTIIALGTGPFDKTKIKDTGRESQEETAFSSVISSAPFKVTTDGDANASVVYDVQNPRAFFDEEDRALSNIRGTIGLMAGQTPEQAIAHFTGAFAAQNLPMTPEGQHGGGLLYVVTKGEFTHYLNFVPSKSGQGTYVVIWSSKPAG